ncbi:unnamed protein product [marine sediment metagenome]|uniref:Uncharacterized protein n=1 Tax=marine sediment metagenome TaxID=412755 RepID=X1CR45_9ZZZZ
MAAITNWKEYTTEEIEAKLEEVNNDFDFDSLFTDDTEEEVEEVVITGFQLKTLECLNIAKTQLKYWEAKNYKESLGSIYMGDELEGDNYSFNYINNKRKNNGIKNSKEDIELYTNDLINSGYKFS